MSDGPDPAVPEEPRDWIFTFGHGQPHFGSYVVINGTWAKARETMFERFGLRWCMQYESREEAGVERWHLTELPWPL